MIPNLEFLHSKFEELNKQCFNEELPHAEIKLNTRWHSLGKMRVRTVKQPDGQPGAKQMWIEISTRRDLTKDEIVNILLHEMIHYYIAFKGLKDNRMHGKIFYQIMNDLNERFGYHLSVHYLSKEENLVHQGSHDRYICIKRETEGCHMMVVAKNWLKCYMAIFWMEESRENVEWYVSNRAIFGMFPVMVRLKFKWNIISEEKLNFYLTGARKIDVAEFIDVKPTIENVHQGK